MHNNYTNKALFLHAILMCLNFENFATLWLKKGKNHVILLETKARGMFINSMSCLEGSCNFKFVYWKDQTKTEWLMQNSFL